MISDVKFKNPPILFIVKNDRSFISQNGWTIGGSQIRGMHLATIRHTSVRFVAPYKNGMRVTCGSLSLTKSFPPMQITVF